MKTLKSCEHTWMIHYSGGSDKKGAMVCTNPLCFAVKESVIVYDLQEYTEKIRKFIIQEITDKILT